jgi:hypothetical protein
MMYYHVIVKSNTECALMLRMMLFGDAPDSLGGSDLQEHEPFPSSARQPEEAVMAETEHNPGDRELLAPASAASCPAYGEVTTRTPARFRVLRGAVVVFVPCGGGCRLCSS